MRFCFRTLLGSAAIPLNATMRSRAQLVWTMGQDGITDIAQVDILPADLVYTRDYSHVGITTGSWNYTWYTMLTPDYSFHAYYSKVGVLATPIRGDASKDQPVWSHVYRWTQW